VADDLKEIFSDGWSVPLGDVIASVGRGVAEAQAALDQASLSQTMALYTPGSDAPTALREIGYRPTFYVLPETSCEVQVSLRVGGSGSADGSAGGAPGETQGAVKTVPSPARLYVTPVDAGFANRFAYDARASAKLTFKIVPVPPPTTLDNARPTPNLIGQTVSDALRTVEALGMRATLVDSAGEPQQPAEVPGFLVKAQTPAPLVIMQTTDTITLSVAAT
jgi:hypothetical protein